ncbi:MAG TPA: tetratricopeptide repeat protein [Dokdonella sp.]|uniref:tetratricopeptide repeat protein n=1 Tax=Dokdonella sp. TaxID=2291710 RepID=UPI002CC739EF|nr:tetratricopeptide repeat protein [Dokdonella sp.]HUD43720.1 tetratricopeptide repeat protein [Dokdonella sp.]
MNPALRARWTELEPLLDRALDLGADARAAFLREAVSDPELRVLLAGLLDGDRSEGFLDANGASQACRLLHEAADAVPDRIGPYRIVRLLGEGGSGSVYLAERDADGYTRQVALKLLRVGLRDPAEQARFRRERRILARLTHPSIARLHDGGFTAEGVPWFALDYIEGQPLTRWCDERRLGLRARLTLLVAVCRAVAHAHRALIVHRDLKPANILVDGDGRPHLLDFGIAKLLDASEHGEDTRTALRRLTPAYAAPEQFTDVAVTTATDVYALGVLLHELATGLRPILAADGEARAASATFDAHAGRDAAALARGTTARALSRSLRGDLDTIVTTAVAVDPQRRYGSAEALADDLERHLQQQPIRARRASARYRLGKFLGRHRVAAVAALLILASVVLGVAATLRESQTARQAALAAARAAERADAVKTFTLALFAGVTPDESRGRLVSARELLERGEARMAEVLDRQPQLRSELSAALAGAWRQLGALDRADALAERALAAADDGERRYAALLELGAVRAAQGRFDEAAQALRAASAAAAGAAARSEADVRLAELLAEAGRPQEAAQLIDATIGADRRDPAGGDRLARDLAALGSIRFRGGDLPVAEQALRESLALTRRMRPQVHTETARRAHDLAVVLLQKGDAAEAATLLQEALHTRVTLLGERHPDVAQSRFNLAVARQRLGDSDTAERLYREALAVQREQLGPSHPDVAGTLNSLAMLAWQRDDVDAAIMRIGEALTAARAAYGEAHPTVATMLGNLASFERVSGRLDAAERDQRAALEIARSALGERHYLVGVARIGLAGTLIEQGRLDEAIAAYRDGLAILEAGLGGAHADVAQARAAYAEALQQAGRLDEAVAAATAARATAATALPAGHPRRARIELAALRLDAAAGGCAAVRPQLTGIVTALAGGGHALRTDRASALLLQARCLREAGLDAEAAEALAQADATLGAARYVPRRLRTERAAL